MVGLNGLEPSTSRLSGVRSNQLSYRPIILKKHTHGKSLEIYHSTNYIHMVEGDGFEPPNPRERIYSPPRLATSLPLHMVKSNGGPDGTRTRDLLRDRQAF